MIPGAPYSTAYMAGLGAAVLGVAAHDNPFHPVRQHEACSEFGRAHAEGVRLTGDEVEALKDDLRAAETKLQDSEDEKDGLAETIADARNRLGAAIGVDPRGKHLDDIVTFVERRLAAATSAPSAAPRATTEA